jgi:WD40 repeat protein
VTGSLDATICLWELKKKKKCTQTITLNSKVNSMKTSKDNLIYASDLSNQVFIYKIA